MFFQETSCSFVESLTVLFCAYLKIYYLDKISKKGGFFFKSLMKIGFQACSRITLMLLYKLWQVSYFCNVNALTRH